MIDHLPANSHFVAAVQKDEEHMRLLEEARQKQGGDSEQKWAPPQAEWSTEAELLASVRDSVKELTHATIQLKLPKGKNAPKWDPYPRPQSIMPAVRRAARREAHEALADRVLARRKRRVAGGPR